MEYLKYQAKKKKVALADSYPIVDTKILPVNEPLPTSTPGPSGTFSNAPSDILSSSVATLPPKVVVVVVYWPPLTQATLLLIG